MKDSENVEGERTMIDVFRANIPLRKGNHVWERAGTTPATPESKNRGANCLRGLSAVRRTRGKVPRLLEASRQVLAKT